MDEWIGICNMYVYTYVYMLVYIYVCMHIYIYNSIVFCMRGWRFQPMNVKIGHVRSMESMACRRSKASSIPTQSRQTLARDSLGQAQLPQLEGAVP